MSDAENPVSSSQPVAEPRSHDLAVMGAAADVMAAEASSAQETRTVAVRELELQMAHQAHGPMGNGNVFGVTPAERLTHAHGMKEFQKAHNQFNVAKIAAASCGLVANAMVLGTYVVFKRVGSSVQLFGKYSARSMKAWPCRDT